MSLEPAKPRDLARVALARPAVRLLGVSFRLLTAVVLRRASAGQVAGRLHLG
jgi:hypothetical protein